jgi:predicted PurR-regulated permease PerM
MVLLTVLALLLIRATSRTLVWLAIALFFAVAISPLVDLVERRLRFKRIFATLLVYVVVLAVLAGLVAIFVAPLVNEFQQLSDKVPTYIDDLRSGRGTLGHLVTRYHLQDYLSRNQDKIRSTLTGAGAPALHYLGVAGEAVAAIVTITVLSLLMVLEGPKLTSAAVAQLPDEHQDRVRRVAHDCARTVTGYITGALLIAAICGVLTFVVLKLVGVPFAGVIALFVAVCDLVPLVGATLGAVVAVVASLFTSVEAAVIVAVWFVVYQQLENHLFQPVVQSRTVKLNPLAVLVSVLLGVELAGILGALVAIPVAGIVQVILRDVYDVRRGRVKPRPTVGEDQAPA